MRGRAGAVDGARRRATLSTHGAIRCALVLLCTVLVATWTPVVQAGDEATAEPVRRIAVPSAGVDSPVEEVFVSGTHWPVPRYNVGHLGETVQPGEPGVAAFIGHNRSGLFGKVFANLYRVKVGDEVIFQFPSKVLRFKVTEVRVVDKRELDILTGPPEPTAMLITCTGTWDWLQWDWSQRLVVIARPEGELSDSGGPFQDAGHPSADPSQPGTPEEFRA